MKRIAILASGEGTNAENIIRYFSERKTAKVVVVITNKAQAGVLNRADKLEFLPNLFRLRILQRVELWKYCTAIKQILSPWQVSC